jgi:hypothetical protein
MKKLVNVHTQQTIVEFTPEKTCIYSKFLEHEMQTLGIPIPHGLRGVYHGKETIFLGDPDFQQAFQEVYYLTSMNPHIFQWS